MDTWWKRGALFFVLFGVLSVAISISGLFSGETGIPPKRGAAGLVVSLADAPVAYWILETFWLALGLWAIQVGWNSLRAGRA